MTDDLATLTMLLTRARERIARLEPLIDKAAHADARAMLTLGTEYGPAQLAYAVGTLQATLEWLADEIQAAVEDQTRDNEEMLP